MSDPKLVELQAVTKAAWEAYKAALSAEKTYRKEVGQAAAVAWKAERAQLNETEKALIDELTAMLENSFAQWRMAKKTEFAQWKADLALSDAMKTAIPPKPKMVWEVETVEGVKPSTLLAAAGQVIAKHNEAKITKGLEPLKVSARIRKTAE